MRVEDYLTDFVAIDVVSNSFGDMSLRKNNPFFCIQFNISCDLSELIVFYYVGGHTRIIT